VLDGNTSEHESQDKEEEKDDVLDMDFDIGDRKLEVSAPSQAKANRVSGSIS